MPLYLEDSIAQIAGVQLRASGQLVGQAARGVALEQRNFPTSLNPKFRAFGFHNFKKEARLTCRFKFKWLALHSFPLFQLCFCQTSFDVSFDFCSNSGVRMKTEFTIGPLLKLEFPEAGFAHFKNLFLLSFRQTEAGRNLFSWNSKRALSLKRELFQTFLLGGAQNSHGYVFRVLRFCHIYLQ